MFGFENFELKYKKKIKKKKNKFKINKLFSYIYFKFI